MCKKNTNKPIQKKNYIRADLRCHVVGRTCLASSATISTAERVAAVQLAAQLAGQLAVQLAAQLELAEIFSEDRAS